MSDDQEATSKTHGTLKRLMDLFAEIKENSRMFCGVREFVEEATFELLSSFSNMELDQDPKKHHLTIKSAQDLQQRISVGLRGADITFQSDPEFPCFEGQIKVTIPEYAILGLETLCFEIVPNFLIDEYNERRSRRNLTGRIVTPILHIDRENGSPFLAKVKVTLPWLPGYLSDEFKVSTENPRSEVKIVESGVAFERVKFSPVAGICHDFNRVQKILEVFCFDGDESLEFETLGIYFMAIQTDAAQIQFDLRKFKTWKEHQMYRVEETHNYQLLAHPGRIKEEDYWSKIKVVIGDFPSESDRYGTHQCALEFEYPDPAIRASYRNRKIFPVDLANDEVFEYSVQFDFESPNLKACHLTGDKIVLKFLSTKKLESISAVVKPSRSLLCDTLNYFNTAEGQLKFLSTYFACFKQPNDICGLFDFILGDIKDTVNEGNFSEGEWNDFTDRARRRHVFQDDTIYDGDRTKFISHLFSCYMNRSLLPFAKSRILKIWEEVRPDWKPEQKLLPENCETLAEALLYLPASQLKLDLKKAIHEDVFGEPWQELNDFVFDINPRLMDQ